MTDIRPLLLVEDDHLDAITAMRALKDIGTPNPVIHAWDGEEALAHLRGDKLPCAILMDLNMPGMDGFTLLEEIRKDPTWPDIPVIVLTTSQDEKDMARCRAYGIAEYLVKCFGYEAFKQKLLAVEHYWRPHVPAAE